MFWDGTAVGDALLVAPYDAATEYSEYMVTASGTGARANKGGVSFGELSNYNISIGVGQVVIAAGIGLCYGGRHKSDANVTVAIPTPGAGTSRIDRIVLRKDWTAKTIRLTRIAGTEAGSPSAPPMVQTVGDRWDVPLYRVTITDAGVITTANDREGLAGSIGGEPMQIDIGDAADAGTSGIPADKDHQHAFPAPASTAQLLLDGASTNGVATTPSRSDHVHETPKIRRVRLTADASSVANNTPADITGFAFAMLNAEVYTFEGVIFFTGGSSSSDIRFIITTPGGSTIRGSWVGPDATTPTTVKQEVGVDIVFGAAGSPLSVWFRGTVVAGADGDLQFQYCQSVTDAGNPVTAQANSHLVATQIGI